MFIADFFKSALKLPEDMDFHIERAHRATTLKTKPESPSRRDP